MLEPPVESTADNPGEVGLVQWIDYEDTDPFEFSNGAIFDGFTLRYETYGKLNTDKSNAILICHALSGDHHCAGIHELNDRKSGWWNNMIGPGKPIDTNRFFVICSNCLGGCQGSTGPSSIDPKTGKAYGIGFPSLSISDMVNAQQRLITKGLGVETLYAVVGGSMGGMQALEWGIRYPDAVKRLLPLATTARQGAQAIAFNEVGRIAIQQDPDWNEGDYGDGKGPDVGLSVARMMAHITYLSDAGLEEKFGRERIKQKLKADQFEAEFQVESYLRYQGQSFTSRFDANSYLYLTKALDRFDLYGETGALEDKLNKIEAKTLVVGFGSDWLFPPEQNRAIVHALLRCGKNASYAQLDTTLGHDSFLVNDPELYQIISSFLAS